MDFTSGDKTIWTTFCYLSLVHQLSQFAQDLRGSQGHKTFNTTTKKVPGKTSVAFSPSLLSPLLVYIYKYFCDHRFSLIKEPCMCKALKSADFLVSLLNIISMKEKNKTLNSGNLEFTWNLTSEEEKKKKHIKNSNYLKRET